MTHVFLHGLGQEPACWQPTIQALGSPMACLCPDLAGLLTKGPCTYDRLYRALEEALLAIPGPMRLTGLSLGGVLALRFAADHPEKAAALILIGTPLRLPLRLLRLQDLVFRLMPQKAFAGMGFPKADVLSLTRSMASLDLPALPPRVRCPALIVRGERDRPNARAARELAEELPLAQALIIPKAGHEVNRDAPDLLGHAMTAFFAAGA